MMRFMCGILLLFPIGQLASAAEEAPIFRWVRDVEVSGIDAVTPMAVPLDSHVFAQTRDDWPDVRLRAADGTPIGFVIRKATDVKSTTVRRTWTAKQTSAQVDSARGLKVELQLGDRDSTPTGLRIITPLRDFEHQVRVETSADGENWAAAGEPTLIFDYSRYVDARNDTVPFLAGTHRRIRFQIEDVTAEQESQLLELHQRLRGGTETERTERTSIARRAFRIDRIEFYVDESKPSSVEPRTTAYPANKLAVTQDEREHRTIVAFETLREPITGLSLVTPAENFSRSATVLSEELDAHGKPHWIQIASGTFTRFAVGALERSELRIAIPESRRRRYRVTLENRDSPALEITGIELTGPVYELTYLASPQQTMELAYGSDTASAGEYDTAALLAALAEGPASATGTLGSPRANPLAPASEPVAWQPWNDGRIHFVVIIGLTLLLGWGLWQASRQMGPPSAE